MHELRLLFEMKESNVQNHYNYYGKVYCIKYTLIVSSRQINGLWAGETSTGLTYSNCIQQ